MKIEHSNWKRLIGAWNTSGNVLQDDGGTHEKIIGTDSYEFILDGNFILHKANVLMGKIKSETHELIQLEDLRTVKMNYYNSNQETGVMRGILNENELRFESEYLRFIGNISVDNNLVSGTWQKKDEGGNWSDFLEIKLSK
jgi:hypothetical protein